jgi:hypothetical protein
MNVIRVAVATNTGLAVAKSGTTAVDQFITCNALEPLCMGSGH